MNFLRDKLASSDLGILLSLGTVLGYGLYYMNAVSFNNYYGLPSNYIDFNLADIALTITMVSVLIFSIVILVANLSLLFTAWPSLKTYIKQIEIGLSVLSFTIGVAFVIYKCLPVEWLNVNQVLYFSILANCCFTYIGWMSFRRISVPVFILVFCLFSVMTATQVGELRANNKEFYLVLEQDKKDYIVINNYKDQFVIAPVNLKKKIITSKLQFIEMKSDKDNKVEVSYRHTGKLKVKYN